MKHSGRAFYAPAASRRHTRPTAEEAFLSCGKASSGVQESPFRLPEKPISEGGTGFSAKQSRRGDGTEERKRMYINALRKPEITQYSVLKARPHVLTRCFRDKRDRHLTFRLRFFRFFIFSFIRLRHAFSGTHRHSSGCPSMK